MAQQGFGRTVYDIGSALGLAVDSIRAHKLRSFLTLLGVIIGVASVIFVGSAIEGLSVYADQSTAKAFGSKTFMIGQVVTAHSMKEYLAKMKRNKRLTMSDSNYLVDVDSDTSLFSPYRRKSVDVKRGGLISELTAVIGVSPEMAEIRDLEVVDGRFFNQQENQGRMNVGVIGDETRAKLFPDGGSPVGKTVQISGIDFTIVGLQEKLGSAFGQSQDNSIYIPVTAFNRLFGPPNDGMDLFGSARPESGVTMQASLDQARVALRTRYHQLPGEPDKFDTLTPDAIRGFIDSILSLVTAIVIPVTAISLVVGGIVIMNIMLVSVTERTREIGIRKALGARRFDIMLQVMIEALLMASLGGAIGVGVGALVTGLVGALFKLKLHITLPYVLISVGVSSMVGVASGWYPASRAAKLDPINALRSE
jgi:putative ABC transport system permease protein